MAAPANDDFANAHVITGISGTIEGTTWEATFESGEPSAFGSPPTVWYSFTPPTTGVYQFIVDDVDNSVGVIIYTGSVVSSLTEVPKRNYQTAGGWSLSSGTTYHIQAYGNQSRFLLYWKGYTAPANDNFEDAELISGSSGEVSYSMIAAGLEDGDPDDAVTFPHPNPDDIGFSNATIWFKWVAPSTGMLRLAQEVRYLANQLALDTDRTTGVFVGTSLDDLTRLQYQELTGTAFYEVEFVDGIVFGFIDVGVVEGTTYYIELGNDSNELFDGGGYLHWKFYPDSLWDGEWGRPPIATPNPGVNMTGYPGGSGSHTLASFTGSVFPQPTDDTGFSWKYYPGSSPVSITSEGIRGEVINNDDSVDVEWLNDIPDNPDDFDYIPNNGCHHEFGFIVDNLKWIDSNSEFEMFAEFDAGAIDLSWEALEKGPIMIVNDHSGDFATWHIGNGVKYRFKVIYEQIDAIEPFTGFLNHYYFDSDGIALEAVDYSWEDSTLDLVKGLIVGRTSGLCGARYNPGTTDPVDIDVGFQVAKLGVPIYYGSRVTASSGSDFDGYFARVNATGTVSLLKRVSGTNTVFGTTSDVILEDGFFDGGGRLILRCRGDNISVWQDMSVGLRKSRLLISATDSTFSSAGYRAILVNENGAQDSGLIRWADPQTYSLERIWRYTGSLSADAGATWQMLGEEYWRESDSIASREGGASLSDFYLSTLNTDDTHWAMTIEGWTPPEVPSGPSALGYFKDDSWHLTSNLSLITGTLGYFKGGSWHLIDDGAF